MRVLIATDSYLPHLGGVQAVATLLARGLMKAGDETAVLAPWDRGLPLEEEIDGVRVTRLHLGRPGLKPREIAGLVRHFPSGYRRVRRLLDEFRPDVVHLIFVNSGLALPLLAARASSDWGFVATAQGQDVLGMTTGLYTGRALSRAVLRNADAVTACSTDLLAKAREVANAPLLRAKAIPNMVNLDEFEDLPTESPHPRPFLLTVAALLPKKGIDLLLRAYAPIASEFSWDLVVLGEGPEHERLLDQARGLGISDCLHLKGAVGREAVTAHLAHAECFVLPSRVEPFGIVLAEAMAAGRAIIAYAAGGIPEVVEDGRQGLLVPCEDVNGLRAAISALLRDPARCRRLGEEGRRRAEAVFSHTVVTEVYRDLYGVAVGDRRARFPA